MPTDTFCSDTFYVQIDPGSLPSFAVSGIVFGFMPLKTWESVATSYVTMQGDETGF